MKTDAMEVTFVWCENFGQEEKARYGSGISASTGIVLIRQKPVICVVDLRNLT